jgi:hypothetical protein
MVSASRLARSFAVAMALSALACEPTPNYPPAMQPIVGHIELEKPIVTSGDDQQLKVYGFNRDGSEGEVALSISIPAGAYPAGTQFAVRLLNDLSLTANTGLLMSRFPHPGLGGYGAFQILPASPPPALPLRIELLTKGDPWSFDLLHASESDKAWTQVASLDATAGSVSFEILEPGLWTLGQLPLPSSLQGRLIQAPSGSMAKVLDLVGNNYSFAQLSADNCYEIEVGRVVAEGGDTLGFEVRWNQYSFLDFVLDPSGDGVTFSRHEDPCPSSSGCGEMKSTIGHFVLSQAGTPGPLPGPTCPESTDAGRD